MHTYFPKQFTIIHRVYNLQNNLFSLFFFSSMAFWVMSKKRLYTHIALIGTPIECTYLIHTIQLSNQTSITIRIWENMISVNLIVTRLLVPDGHISRHTMCLCM